MRVARPRLVAAIRRSLKWNPVTAILGPRQCGKTTLARAVAGTAGTSYFDLERSADFDRLASPERALDGARGLVVLDEIQRRPELFNYLRIAADRRPLRCRFLVLGSAAPGMVRGVSESLAGRVGFVTMGGFTVDEVGAAKTGRLWLRGGFPRAFLAASEAQGLSWREHLIQTYLERDLPQLEVRAPAVTMRRFWTMVAHAHGQRWNGAEIAASLGFSHPMARRYLDVLAGTYMVRQLQPWFLNLGKRTVKAPKVYLRDTGLLHALLGIASRDDLESHPKLGASWEGFALEQILARAGDRHAYHWATHAGAELDLLIGTETRRWGFEFKCADVPRLTRSLASAIEELRLEHAWIVHPGASSWQVHDRATVLALSDLDTALKHVAPRA